MTKLKTIPMSSVMYVKLVNTYSKTTAACSSCTHDNGECMNFAIEGKCNAMSPKINEILVFNTGELEFATTRRAISKALEYNEDLPEYWQGVTVDAVIEDYLKEFEDLTECNKLEELGSFYATCILDMISQSDIIAEVARVHFDTHCIDYPI